MNAKYYVIVVYVDGSVGNFSGLSEDEARSLFGRFSCKTGVTFRQWGEIGDDYNAVWQSP